MESIGFVLAELFDEKNRDIINREGNQVKQREIDTLYIKKELIK